MKKTIAILLTILIVTALLPTFAVYADDTAEQTVVLDGAVYVNLALGKKYTTTGTRYVGVTNYSDTETDGTLRYRLTDGNISYNGTDNIGCHEGTSTEVVIDLEEVSLIKAAQTDLWGGNWGISDPSEAKVEFFCSVDGIEYIKLGETASEKEAKDSGWIKMTFSAVNADTVSARYVKIQYNTGRFRWASEIFVYGKGDLAENEHTVETVDGVDYIRDFSAGCELETVIRAFGSKAVSVKTSSGNEKTSGLIGTGDVITAGDREYVAVVRGDTNGDGKLSSSDYINIRLKILSKKSLTAAQELAGDINFDGKINARDYTALRLLFLGKVIDLDGNKAPVIVGVTMPEISEYVETNVVKGSSSVTFTAANSQQSGYKTEISMVKTSWGTWNLGYYKVTDSATGKTLTMNPGGTDWEYVFRVGASQSSIYFCGGNHGNEKLLEIAFYDASTGALLGNDEAFTATANGVKIVEKTQVYFNEQPNMPVLNVTRSYVINGVDVWLECDFDVVSDSYFSLSYTAMACIPKTSGNHIIYYNTDGTTREWSTNSYGTSNGTDYSSDGFDYGNAAASVDMYGDANPDMRFHVEIYDSSVMCDNFVSHEKTFFWDMNATQNKLYFSKFNQVSATMVSKGTHWDTLARWSFFKLEQ